MGSLNDVGAQWGLRPSIERVVVGGGGHRAAVDSLICCGYNK